MILRTDFATIDTEITTAIATTLDQLRTDNLNDYLLFLADAEYNSDYASAQSKLNPHVIDNRMDWYKDESRIRFLAEFLGIFYAFPNSQTATDDREQRLHMELMVYSHIWEAKPFLKKLYRLAHLVGKEPYAWTVTIPDMSKHDFIRNDIRQILDNNHNPIAGIIRNGFHTSLRNAFAHSEYWFDTMNNNRRIILDNFKGAYPGELDQISFDDWSRRFVYSALLSYYLFKISHDKRTALIDDLGTDLYTITIPGKNGGSLSVPIRYRKEYNAFNFEPQKATS